MWRICIFLSFGSLGCAGIDQAGGGSETESATESGSSAADPTEGFDIDTTPWAETDAPATSTAGDDGNSSGPAAEDDESDDSVEPETFVGIFGFGQAVIGESYAPQGEMVVVLDDEDECLIEWTASAVPDDTCPECEFAFRLTIESLEVIEDITCADYGQPYFDEGASFGIGMFEEELFFDEGRGWEWSEGGGELIPEREVFEWEIELEH